MNKKNIQTLMSSLLRKTDRFAVDCDRKCDQRPLAYSHVFKVFPSVLNSSLHCSEDLVLVKMPPLKTLHIFDCQIVFTIKRRTNGRSCINKNFIVLTFMF